MEIVQVLLKRRYSNHQWQGVTSNNTETLTFTALTNAALIRIIIIIIIIVVVVVVVVVTILFITCMQGIYN